MSDTEATEAEETEAEEVVEQGDAGTVFEPFDVEALEMTEPLKVYPKPGSAIDVAVWGRQFGVFRKGRLRFGDWFWNIAVARAQCNAAGREEVIAYQMLRREALGLPSDKYSTICAIALESGLFKIPGDAADPVEEALKQAEELARLARYNPNPQVAELAKKTAEAIYKAKQRVRASPTKA
jgi:hypothetical protein